jgi:hypothetical protein
MYSDIVLPVATCAPRHGYEVLVAHDVTHLGKHKYSKTDCVYNNQCGIFIVM